jgi:hypothetical protein
MRADHRRNQWTLIVDENIKLEPTSEQFAVPLFHVTLNNRKHLSEFLP